MSPRISKKQNPAPIPLVAENDAAIRTELTSRLLALNFHAFCKAIALLLNQMGYEDVQLAGRTNWKGRNGRDGNTGYDLTAIIPGGLSRRRIIVQVKQFDASQPLYQRTLDELRGTCLRVGASEALLITTGSFASSVAKQRNALHESPVAPVRLMDGERLLTEMLSHGVGVVTRTDTGPWEPGFYQIDESFFTALSSLEGNGRDDCAQPGSLPFLVTVSVQPLRHRRVKATTNLPIKRRRP